MSWIGARVPRWRVYGVRVAQLAGGRAIATVVQAVTLIWLARLSGPEDFGALSVVLAVAGYASVIGDYGLGTLILRTRARQESGHLQEILSVSVRLLALTAGVLALGVVWWTFVSGYALWLSLLAVSAGVEKFTDNSLMISVADGRTRVMAMSLVARRSMTLLALLASFLAGTSVIAGYCVGSLVASVVALTAIYPEVARAGGVRRRSSGHRVLREGFPFFLSGASAQLRSLDSVILGLFGGVMAAGGYAAASRLMSPVTLLTSSLSPVVMPETARRSGPFAVASASAILRVVAAISVALSPSLLFGGQVMGWVFGAAYGAMGPTLAVLLLAAPWLAGAMLVEAIAQSQGCERRTAAASLAVGAGQVLVMALGAYWAGAVGVASAVLAVGLARAFVMYAILARAVRGGGRSDGEALIEQTAADDSGKWDTSAVLRQVP